MSEDNRKLNSWWQSGWFGSYIKILVFGVSLILVGFLKNNLPEKLKIIFIGFGILISILGYFAAKSRWNKI